jgi:hypothetical protein
MLARCRRLSLPGSGRLRGNEGVGDALVGVGLPVNGMRVWSWARQRRSARPRQATSARLQMSAAVAETAAPVMRLICVEASARPVRRSADRNRQGPSERCGRPAVTLAGRSCDSARKLDKRCARRADGAPGSARRRFHRSERLCGQGQDRTVDLPLFRSTAPSAVQTCENGRHSQAEPR